MSLLTRVLTPLAAALVLASPLRVGAVELQMAFTEAGAYAFDTNIGPAGAIDDRDPWSARAIVGVSSAEFDFGTGLGRLYTTDPVGATVRGGQASVGFFFSIRNPGDAPVTFEAGAISVDVDAAFTHSVGTGIEGVQVLSGGLFRVGGGVASAGQSLINRSYFDSPLMAAGTLLPGHTVTGSARLDVRANTADALDYSMSFAELTIAPRSRADFEFEFSGSVTVGAGSHAEVDAMSTVRLRMTLPEGVTVASEQPLAWVTAVPEPSTSALLIIGAVLLGIAARRRAGGRGRVV
jgi:hypothetical protein